MAQDVAEIHHDDDGGVWVGLVVKLMMAKTVKTARDPEGKEEYRRSSRPGR